MTIKELIKSGKMTSEVSDIKRVSCVNVGFVNSRNERDETQLTVESSILTKAGEEELSKLFASLAKELDTDVNAVTYITVIASADSCEELEAMGY